MNRGRRWGGILAVSAVAGCGEPTAQTPHGPPSNLLEPVRVAIIPDGVIVPVGDSLQMRAQTTPPVAAKWSWSMSPGAGATITQTGLVRAHRASEVEVIACAETVRDGTFCGRAPLTIR